MVEYPELITDGDEKEIRAYALSIASNLKILINSSTVFPEELKFVLNNIPLTEPDRLCDFALLINETDADEVELILNSFNLMERLQKTLLLLKKEVDFLKIKEKINKQIEDKINQHQREFFSKRTTKSNKKRVRLMSKMKKALN